jgi:hypothetical protein
VTADELVERLDGVRARGPGRWSARCPAHEDRSPSLSILATDDRVLVHCFAGCAVPSICAAVGIELRDLFHDNVRRRRWHDEVQDEMRRRIPAREILDSLAYEVAVVAHIAADMMEHREIDQEKWERLSLAHRRISGARAVVTPPSLRS